VFLQNSVSFRKELSPPPMLSSVMKVGKSLPNFNIDLPALSTTQSIAEILPPTESLATFSGQVSM
jgi:hypothetical protein